MTEFRPDNFMILPTMVCQASCQYCFAKKTGRIMDHVTALAALDFIFRIAPKGKDFHLTFHGGEPLLAGEDFYRWILPETIARFGRRVHLSVQSNLWAMTNSLAELFAQYQVSIGTSLDGPQDMCDEQRGEGYYDKTMTGIHLLRQHGIAADIICTFTGENAGRAAEVFTQSQYPYSIHGAVPVLETGGKAVHEAVPLRKEQNCNLAGCRENQGTVSVDQMTQLLLDSYEAYKNDPSHCRISTIDAFVKGCYDEKGTTCTFFDCLGVFAAIDPGGDVYTCQRFCGMKEYSVGNVCNGLTERDILQSPGYMRLRAVEEGKKDACGDCSHWQYCMGGCLYNTLARGGEKDPYCEAYREVYDRIGHDMALEMGSAMLGRDVPMPVLAMAGDRPHPYDMRRSKQRMKLALECGKRPEGFESKLRSRFPENDLNMM